VAHERRLDLTRLAGLLAAALRADPGAASALAAWDLDDVCSAAEHHGVLPLLADRVAAAAPVPEALAARLRADASRHLAVDLAREVELRQCLASLHAAGIPALVFKGAHLSYRFYPRPDLRPRVDTDLLVPAGAQADAARVLGEEGYQLRPSMGGELVTSQAMYVKRRGGEVLHAVDLHWRVANPQVFAGVLTFDELSLYADMLPPLSRGARGLSSVYALLMACVHRVAHHYDTDRLIWLYDIHLIASQLGAGEWQRFAALASDRGVLAVCRQGIARALAAFAGEWKIAAETAMGEPSSVKPEATAAYLEGDRRLAAHLLIDLRALSSWSLRWRLLKDQVFPSAQYMRDTYAPASGAPLPVLYTRRVLHGAKKWLARF